jgi:hypothetical protein
MVSKSEAFPSKYLKASDLGDQPAIATIKVAALENIKGFDGKEQPKVVCYFSKHFKPLPLNRTNFDSIMDIAGSDETDDWAGTKIELYPSETAMNGKILDCIRIRKPNEPAKLKRAAKGDDAKKPTLAEEMDDEIPDLAS